MKGKKWLLITIAVINVLLITVVAVLWASADRNGPVIEFSENDTVYQAGMDYTPLYNGVSARDAKDGDVTDRIVIEKVVEDEAAGTVTVTYAASDLSGNVTKISRVFKMDNSSAEASEEGGAGTVSGDDTEAVSDSSSDAAGDVKAGNADSSDAGADQGADPGTGTQADADDAKGAADGANAGSDPTGTNEGTSAASDQTDGQDDKKEESRKVTLDDLSEEEQKAIKDEALAAAKAQQEREKQRAEAKAAKAAEQAEAARAADTSKPSITLKSTSIKTIPGQNPVWIEAIEGLHDDKDSYAQLFGTLKFTKFDVNTPGTYNVGLTVKDSDGNVSDPVYVNVLVK